MFYISLKILDMSQIMVISIPNIPHLLKSVRVATRHAQDVAAVAILATFQFLRVFQCPAEMLMALGFALAFVAFWVLCLGHGPRAGQGRSGSTRAALVDWR